MLKDILLDCYRLIDEVEHYEQISNIQVQSILRAEIANIRDLNMRQDVYEMIYHSKNVVNKITRDYIKNLTVEDVKSDSDGKIYFKNLSMPIISIKNITDELNNPIIFNCYYDYVKVPIKNSDLSVAYYFENKDLGSIFESYMLPLGVTEHIIALGTVSEYLSKKLLYSEAKMYESMFKEELEDVRANKKNRSFPAWRKF